MAQSATIADVTKAVTTAATVGYGIFNQVAKFMDAMQKSSESGHSKKEWVMAKMQSVIVGGDWFEWGPKISAFIDSIKTIWNFVTGRTVKEPQPHQVRVVKEHEDLSTKLEALKQFLSKDKPPFIDDENWDLLNQQYKHMWHYEDVLRKRIKLF